MIEARNDPVADLGRFGDDPNQLDGLTDLSSGAGRAPDQMQAEVRNRLSTEISRLTWVNDDNESRGGCGFEFPEVREGQSRSLA
ncbi:MAG: hypothetical protein ACRD0P_33830, partial [Stackebrandtia sp.]